MNKKALEIQYVVALLLALGAAAVVFVFLSKTSGIQPPFQQTDYCPATGKTWAEYEKLVKVKKTNKQELKEEMLRCFPTREQAILKL